MCTKLPYVSTLPETFLEWYFSVLYLLCCKLFQTLSSCTKAFKIQMVVKSPVENRLLIQTSVLFFSLLVHSRFWQIRRNIHSLMQLDSSLAWTETSGPKAVHFTKGPQYMHMHLLCWYISLWTQMLIALFSQDNSVGSVNKIVSFSPLLMASFSSNIVLNRKLSGTLWTAVR